MNNTFISIFFIYLLLSSTFTAQPWKQNDLIFNPSGIPSLAFSQPRFVDLDADGDFDMILGNLDDIPLYFENIGTPSQPKFREEKNFFSFLSSIDAEMGVCEDLDGDGDLDLITGGYTGLHFYENIGDSSSAFFNEIENYFNAINVGSNPIPTFADVDADGDLDLIIGLSENGAVKLYTNTGTKNSARFSELNVMQIADVGLYAYPYFCDLDNDGDYDILVGRDGYGFYYYKNNGTASTPSWQNDNSPFSGLGNTTYWNSPCLVDLNGDDKFDLVYGTASGPLQYYINTGTVSSPAWTVNNSLFGGVLDVGGASSPCFFDFDNDGDLDLISGSNLGNIKYYRNIGSASAPAWEAAHTYFSSIKHSIYSAITLGDLNGDSLPDAVAGDLNGKLFFHRNTGSGFVEESSMFSSISLGGWSAPKLIDMDSDGDLDIVAGNESGNLIFIENTGTTTSPAWTRVNGYFGSIDVGSNCVVDIGDLDRDGDLDIVTGNIQGKVQYFQNDGGKWSENPSVVSGISGGQNTAPAFADLDGDGDLDLVLGNYDGTFNYFENETPTGIYDNAKIVPMDFVLNNVYPNPFNGSVVFSGNINQRTSLQLEVYNLLGQKVLEKTKSPFPSGEFQFIVVFPQNLTSGVYYYHVKPGLNKNDSIQKGKVVFVK